MAKLTSRAEDYSKWYNELIVGADLAENSGVRGCMVIKPYGYAIWEKMRDELDRRFKETGHQNAYFPIFVPKSLFEAEEKNAEGFAKECAVVTHYRLKTDPENPSKLIVDPEAKLEEELIVRPTSEAIIWNTYKPMGECGSMGDENASVPPYFGIPLAGRAYSSRYQGRSRSRSKTDDGSLC